jgi:hypothetical protein
MLRKMVLGPPHSNRFDFPGFRRFLLEFNMHLKSFSQRRSGIRTAVVASGLLMALGHSQAATFEVFARDNSTAYSNNDIVPPAAPLDTGLSFVNGQTLTVTASGSWNGGCGSIGPDGGGACSGTASGPQDYSLVGRIGLAGSYFQIGSSYSAPVSGNGHLFLAFVDSDAANNTGSVMATISAVPEPATYALLIAGLGLVGVAGRRRSGKPG